MTGPAAYTVAFTAKSGSTQWLLTPTSAFTQAVGYFTQGVVTCTSGANNGLAQTVKLHDASGNLELMQPWLKLSFYAQKLWTTALRRCA